MRLYSVCIFYIYKNPVTAMGLKSPLSRCSDSNMTVLLYYLKDKH